MCERSGSAGKPVRGIEKPTCKNKVGLHMQTSHNRYLEKVFQHCRQKLNLSKDAKALNEKPNVSI